MEAAEGLDEELEWGYELFFGTRRLRPRAGQEELRPWRTRVKIGNWGYLQISPVRDEFRPYEMKEQRQKRAYGTDKTGSATSAFYSAPTTAMHFRQFYVFELTCLNTSLYHVVEVPSSEGSKGFFRKPPTPSYYFSDFLTKD